MKKFEVGKVYFCKSVCDHECIYRFLVVKRTAQTITVIDLDEQEVEEKKIRLIKKLSEMKGVETCYPLGNFSLCPVLTAEKEFKD